MPIISKYFRCAHTLMHEIVKYGPSCVTHMGPKQPPCSHGLIGRKRRRDNSRGRSEGSPTQRFWAFEPNLKFHTIKLKLHDKLALTY